MWRSENTKKARGYEGFRGTQVRLLDQALVRLSDQALVRLSDQASLKKTRPLDQASLKKRDC